MAGSRKVKPWSAEEIGQLHEMVRAKLSKSEIAAKLGRGIIATNRKAEREGLLFGQDGSIDDRS